MKINRVEPKLTSDLMFVMWITRIIERYLVISCNRYSWTVSVFLVRGRHTKQTRYMNLIKTFIFKIKLVLVLNLYKFSISYIYNIRIPQFPIWKKSIFVSQQCDLHRCFCIDKRCVHILITYIYIYIYIYINLHSMP